MGISVVFPGDNKSSTQVTNGESRKLSEKCLEHSMSRAPTKEHPKKSLALTKKHPARKSSNSSYDLHAALRARERIPLHAALHARERNRGILKAPSRQDT